MIAYGWTIEHFREAIRYVNGVYAEHGGVPVELRNLTVKTNRCRIGNCTIQFRLGFSQSTRHRKDGTCPPGASYHQWSQKVYHKDPAPLSEVGFPEGYYNGRRVEVQQNRRSTGNLCWHAHGHFMAYMFEQNPNGRFGTVKHGYNGQREFEEDVSLNRPGNYEKCHCSIFGLEQFFNMRR